MFLVVVSRFVYHLLELNYRVVFVKNYVVCLGPIVEGFVGYSGDS